MSDADWPSPEPSSREPAPRPSPLPRVEDLPIAEQGYDREKVQEAFDAFYRHAAQLDATLRTLEGVEVFQRTAAELRAELRTIRGSGLSVGSWQSGAGYGARQSVTEWSPSPAVKRVAGEFAFLILVGAIVGWAKWSSLTIVLVMAFALAIVLLVEWVAARERAIPHAAAPAQVPALDEPAELEAAPAPAEQQQGPEAMTIFGGPPVREAEPAEPAPAEPGSEAAVSSDGHGEMTEHHRDLAEEAEPILDAASAGDSHLDGGDSPAERLGDARGESGDSHVEPVGDSPGDMAPAAAALEDTAEESVFASAAEEDIGLEAVAIEDVASDDVAVAAVSVEPETEPEVPVAAEEPRPDEDPGVSEPPEPEEPKPDEEREVAEPKEPDKPEEEREDDLVAAAEELELAPEPGTALGGVEPLETGRERRRFRLFRRRRSETPSADELVAEHVPGEPLEPAPGSPLPSVQPGPDLEPPDLEPEEPEEPEERVDPWERGAEELEPVEAFAEPEPIEPQPRRPWFRREHEYESEREPEPIAQADPEPDPEPEPEEPPELTELPVEALAEQAAVALERSRARRRPARRARRR